jgi:transcription antitermination protein NusB
MTSASKRKPGRGTRARSVARKIAMQALYQWQLTGHSAAELRKQFLEDENSAGADTEYFGELLEGCLEGSADIKAVLATLVDRPLEQLDPVEAAILMIGIFELQHRLDVPYRVTINEGVDLAKRFGATDAHKYINAVLDRAAGELRPTEKQ